MASADCALGAPRNAMALDVLSRYGEAVEHYEQEQRLYRYAHAAEILAACAPGQPA